MFTLYFILALSLPFLEIAIDHFLWNRGLDDKPYSTLLRFIFAFLLTWFSHPFAGLFRVPVMIVSAYALFDPALNLSRGLHWAYHPRFHSWWEDFWRKRKGWAEIMLRLVWFSIGVVIYFL